MDKKDRINKAYEWLLWKKVIRKQEDVATKMGSTQANVSSALKGNTRVLTDNFLRRFWQAYMEYISFDWLLYGTGDMLTHYDQQHERTQHPAIIPDSPAEFQPISTTLPPEHEQKTEDEPIPAWADSLITLVSNNTAVIESLRKDNAALLQEIAELRTVVVSLRSSLLSIHHSVIYDEKISDLPLAAEKI